VSGGARTRRGPGGTGPTTMTGRVVVVTGGTSGIGRATALALAEMGATVALTGRSRTRTEAAVADLHGATGADVRGFAADLSEQSQVRRLAAELSASLPRIDVLVNNAGGYWNTRHVTADGLERTFAVNHLAPFLLTHLLLDRISASADGRVITVASNAQSLGRIDFDDLQGQRSYSGARAYNQSKLANVLFTRELASRLEGSTVTANALHPGVVRTSFGAEDPAPLQRLLLPLAGSLMRTPARGAATSVHLASSPALIGVRGQFFADRRPRRLSGRSTDHRVARRLWEVSAQLVGLG
jgi:retinol dehydrogenase 14